LEINPGALGKTLSHKAHLVSNEITFSISFLDENQLVTFWF
jgi:hypothetical protein